MRNRYRIILRPLGSQVITINVTWNNDELEKALFWFKSKEYTVTLKDVDNHIHILRADYLDNSAIEIIEVA